MDISTRLIKINICAAIVFAAYFYLQTCDMYLQALSFFVTVPIAKNVLDCMLVPVEIENGRGYPVKKLFVNFLKCGFGVYSVITIEMIRRIAYCGVFNGVLSIMLMCAWLLGYFFSASTGVCHANVKVYRRGKLGFTIMSWLQICASILMGSGWVVRIHF